MGVEFYTYRCLRSAVFAAQEAERNQAREMELPHALMGLARDLATPLPAAEQLPPASEMLIEETPLAGLLLGGLNLDAVALAAATAEAYGVILPEDLAAALAPVTERPSGTPEMDKLSAREILAARKAKDNHVNTRHRLISLIIPRAHLPSARLLDALGIKRYHELVGREPDELEAERLRLNAQLYALVDGDEAAQQEMYRLFPPTRGIHRRRRRS